MTVDLTVLITLNGIKRDKKPQKRLKLQQISFWTTLRHTHMQQSAIIHQTWFYTSIVTLHTHQCQNPVAV